jgi:Na+/H+ antiporter NhaC
MAIGAIFSGAVFGDHCSPISDTTVMSSIFAGADHIAHVRTQIPYALVPAGIGGILFLLANPVQNAFPLLFAGLVVQFFIFRFLTRYRTE